MEEVKINSEDLEKIDGRQEITVLENYILQEDKAESVICNCMEYIRRSGRTYMYRGVGSGCVRAVFSRNGRVTSTISTRIVRGNNYNFTPLSGEDLGFQCC